MVFVQASTLPPRMHQKLSEHGNCCMQNNQLSTQRHIELEDNSKVEKQKKIGRKILLSIMNLSLEYLVMRKTYLDILEPLHNGV